MSAHAANLGSDAAQLFFDALVAAIHVIDAVEDGLAIGDQGGEDERGRSAQVGTHDGGRGETRRAAHGGGASIHLDVGAHADQFLHVHEAILEDVFADLAYAFSLRGKRHVLGLHVGGKAGIFFGGDVGAAERAVGAHADCVGTEDFHVDTCLLKLGDHGAEVSWLAVGDDEVAAGDGAGDEKGSRLNAIGIDAVARAMEAGYSLDA